MSTIPAPIIPVGTRVRINETCVPDYIGLTGTVTEIDLEAPEEDTMNHYVEFDRKGSQLGEYFAFGELDILRE